LFHALGIPKDTLSDMSVSLARAGFTLVSRHGLVIGSYVLFVMTGSFNIDSFMCASPVMR